MAKKLTEEQKAEKKAIKELDVLTEKMAREINGDEEKKPDKKAEKKYGKRVHVVSDAIIKCRATFIEEVLGGWPGDEQIFSTYIASKAPDAMTREEEIATYGEEDVEKQQTTIFPKDKDGKPCIVDYQMRGYLKSAAKALKRAGLLEVTAHEKVINDLIKISASPRTDRIDRWIKLVPPPGVVIGLKQRPLRVSTPKGERTALASSEMLPAGTKFYFYIHLLTRKIQDATLSWMEYGKLTGMGQWRNSGCGRFFVEVEKDGDWVPIESV